MYENTYSPPPLPDDLPKHSVLGIISFVIGILASLLLCITFAIAGFSSPQTFGTSLYENMMTVIGLMACASGGMSVLGLGLGIGGVIQKAQSKVFGIIGLVVNGLLLLGFCGLMLLGIIAGGML